MLQNVANQAAFTENSFATFTRGLSFCVIYRLKDCAMAGSFALTQGRGQSIALFILYSPGTHKAMLISPREVPNHRIPLLVVAGNVFRLKNYPNGAS